MASGPAPSLAAFNLARAHIGIVLDRKSLPTLGEVAWAVARDLKWSPGPMAQEEYVRWRNNEFQPYLWRILDQRLGHRPDYRLWRLIAKHIHPSDVSLRWPSLHEIALEAINKSDTIVVWGALAVLSGFLTSKDKLSYLLPDIESQKDLASGCELRLLAGLPSLPGGEVGCALIRALTWAAVQEVFYRRSAALRLTLQEQDIIEHYNRLERSLRDADPNWEPGRMLAIGDALKSEQRMGLAVAPHAPIAMEVRLAEALFRARGAARLAIQSISRTTQDLLERTVLLAFSSWLLSRSLRIGEEQFQTNNPDYVPQYDLHLLSRNEMIALKRLSLALQDAGYYHDAAFAAWLCLTLVPVDPPDDDEFRDIGDKLAGKVRNAGLAVPSRFERPKDENKRRRRASYSRPNPLRPSDPLRLRLERDWGLDDRWKTIANLDGHAASNPMSALSQIVDRRRELSTNPDVLCAAFGLCLKYGRLSEAVELSACFQLGPRELMDLAHSMKRALQFNLVAVDREAHRTWTDILRNGWTNLPTDQSVTKDERLVLHEVLEERYPAILRNAHVDNSRVFALHLYNQLEDQAVPKLMDIGRRAFRRGPAVVSIRVLQDRLRELGKYSNLGPPISVSAVRLADGSVSLLGISAFGVDFGRVPLPNITVAAKQVQSTYRAWFRRASAIQIPSHSKTRELADAIISLVNRLDPSCRCLALALEPELASLPWTALINSRAPELIASLIPGLSWLAADRAVRSQTNGSPQGAVGPILRMSDAADLSVLRERIEDQENSRNLPESCAIVLGHGQPSDQGISSVVVDDKPLALQDWLALSAHRLLIVHSCHGGRVSRSFPGDLGGLPGLSLAIGCHACLASVTEVPLDAAWALQDEIGRADGPQEIGLRYLAAMCRNSAVALYNIYGLPNERLSIDIPPPTIFDQS